MYSLIMVHPFAGSVIARTYYTRFAVDFADAFFRHLGYLPLERYMAKSAELG